MAWQRGDGGGQEFGSRRCVAVPEQAKGLEVEGASSESGRGDTGRSAVNVRLD
jgi:hypothetical protein